MIAINMKMTVIYYRCKIIFFIHGIFCNICHKLADRYMELSEKHHEYCEARHAH